jgi:hypothetical protein
VRPLQRIFFWKISKISPYFLEIYIKFAIFWQWVRVARQELCRIQKKLYCPPRVVAI